MALKTRLARLEAVAPSAGEAVDTILIHVVEPSPEGPRDCGPEVALFVGGGSIQRAAGESAADFLARVEAAKP